MKDQSCLDGFNLFDEGLSQDPFTGEGILEKIIDHTNIYSGTSEQENILDLAIVPGQTTGVSTVFRT